MLGFRLPSDDVIGLPGSARGGVVSIETPGVARSQLLRQSAVGPPWLQAYEMQKYG